MKIFHSIHSLAFVVCSTVVGGFFVQRVWSLLANDFGRYSLQPLMLNWWNTKIIRWNCRWAFSACVGFCVWSVRSMKKHIWPVPSLAIRSTISSSFSLLFTLISVNSLILFISLNSFIVSVSFTDFSPFTPSIRSRAPLLSFLSPAEWNLPLSHVIHHPMASTSTRHPSPFT